MCIAFARGGAHLPIAHTLRLPETEIIVGGGRGISLGAGDFLDFFWFGGFFFGAEDFFGGG